MKKYLICLAAATILSSAAQAATFGVVVNPGVQTIANPAGGGGFTAVTGNAPRAAAGSAGANGSLEIHGDRSRYVVGSIFENFAGSPAPALGLFSDLDQLTFDWQTAVVGSGQAHAAPAVRIHVIDPTLGGNVRSEIIWEYVYNGGTAGTAPPSGWQVSGNDSRFYINVRDNDGAAFLANAALQGSGAGYTINGGTQGEVYFGGGLYTQSISTLQSLFSSSAYITGFSFGAGSGFGSNFVGYVDNVAAVRGSDQIVLNFELAATAVPEPASWAMMISGFGLVGGAMRTRRRETLVTA